MSEFILKFNTLLSLVTVGVCIFVFYVWFPRLKKSNFRSFDPRELLIIGIFISFFCACCDNIYWGITWLSKLQNWETSQWWFDHGLINNLFFRHCGKILAGICHLEAARLAGAISKEDLICGAIFIIFISLSLYFTMI